MPFPYRRSLAPIPLSVAVACALWLSGCGSGGSDAEVSAGTADAGDAATTAERSSPAGTAGRAADRGAADQAVPKVGGASTESGLPVDTEVKKLREENRALVTKLSKQVPKDPYIVVNTTLNRLYLRKDDQTLVDAVCSTGSNTELVDSTGKRRWFFSTPKGVFSVRNKMIAPVWVKPDWAFVEEGEPVPHARADERYEEGVLGKYGLYFGNGYLIHGTLFQRFLGQAVTHGCIRLGDEDLERLYKNARVGTKIYIY